MCAKFCHDSKIMILKYQKFNAENLFILSVKALWKFDIFKQIRCLKYGCLGICLILCLDPQQGTLLEDRRETFNKIENKIPRCRAAIS